MIPTPSIGPANAMSKYPFQAMTILGVLQRAVERDSEKTIVRFVDDRGYTAGEILDRARRIGASLKSSGCKPGDKIGIIVGNRVEFLTAWFGSFTVGCVPVPLNTAQRGTVLSHMLALCDIRVAVIDDAFVDAVIDVVQSVSSVKVVCIVSNATAEVSVPTGITAAHFGNWETNPDIADVYQSTPSDLATLMLTSGTTGPSKAVMFSHTTGVIMASQACQVWGYEAGDISYTCLPLFHGNALFCSFLATLLVGAEIAVGSRFSASRFWQEVGETRATKISLLGTMHGILYRQPPAPSDRQHSVSRAALVPAPTGYYREFEERFGVTVTQFSGLTDANMITGILPCEAEMAKSKPSSCGPALEYWDVKIVDDLDDEVPHGTVGEMVVRPRVPFSSPLGYYKMPEATVNLWRNMWSHTGDYFRQDEDGWFYFADRKKDALRRAGENISSQEVENVLRLFPGILDAAVYAVPSQEGEDDVAAAIEVGDDWIGDFEALLRYCFAELAYFAIPRYVRVVAVLPRTESQKVQKEILRSEGVPADAWDRGPGGRAALEARLISSIDTA